MTDTELIDFLERTHLLEDHRRRVAWDRVKQRWKVIDKLGLLYTRATLREALEECR